MFERVFEKLRADALALIIRVDEYVPKRAAEYEVRQHAAEGYQSAVVTYRKAHAGAFEHLCDLLKGAAPSPAREAVEVLQVGGGKGELAVVKCILRI